MILWELLKFGQFFNAHLSKKAFGVFREYSIVLKSIIAWLFIWFKNSWEKNVLNLP